MADNDGGEFSSILQTVPPVATKKYPKRTARRRPSSTGGKPGRPRMDPEHKVDIARRVDIACKRLSSRALDVLERAMDETKTPNLDYKYRIQAATHILDRAFGRPKQAVEATVTLEGGEAFLKLMQEARERVKPAVKSDA